jgi:DNA invertase Pin-like site-specific DNA recombinase
MKFGYSRISTSDQSLNPQDDQLRKEGCERIFSDIASGAQEERSALKDLLSHARKGDVVVVVKLDRLGRSLKHLIEIVGELEKEGIGLKSLSEGIDTSLSLNEHSSLSVPKQGSPPREPVEERGEDRKRSLLRR